MSGVLSRDYCRDHPWEIGRLYGWNVLVGSLVGGRSVLERIATHFAATRAPMPPPLGTSYRIATLLELRAAKIYGLLAKRFADVPQARALFAELEAEEQEHARLMTVCLYTVRQRPTISYAPSVMDPEIRRVMNELRAAQRRVPTMTLEEAFETSVALEQSEVNVIFGKLLDQVAEPEVALLRDMMHHAEDHAVSVPRRIGTLRAQLARRAS